MSLYLHVLKVLAYNLEIFKRQIAMIVCTVYKLMIIGILILAVDDQPGWNSVPLAVKLLKQEGAMFLH